MRESAIELNCFLKIPFQLLVVRDEKKLVFDGFDQLNSGDLVLTLIPK